MKRIEKQKLLAETARTLAKGFRSGTNKAPVKYGMAFQNGKPKNTVGHLVAAAGLAKRNQTTSYSDRALAEALGIDLSLLPYPVSGLANEIEATEFNVSKPHPYYVRRAVAAKLETLAEALESEKIRRPYTRSETA